MDLLKKRRGVTISLCVFIGMFRQEPAISGRAEIKSYSYTYNELGDLGGEENKPLDFGVIKEGSSDVEKPYQDIPQK